ncbi:MAG: hypothetical protein WAT79_08665 [Saprospiraceae bacterium]
MILVFAKNGEMAYRFMSILANENPDLNLSKNKGWMYCHNDSPSGSFVQHKGDVILLDGWHRHRFVDYIIFRLDIGDFIDKTSWYQKLIHK